MAITGIGMSALIKNHILMEFKSSNECDVKKKRDETSFPYPPHQGKRH
jgi:hypothetical protein